jgi:hypothetical protein
MAVDKDGYKQYLTTFFTVNRVEIILVTILVDFQKIEKKLLFQ